MSGLTKKIIAVEFDGCLVVNKYPKVGEPIEKNISKLKVEQEAGARVILWTNRSGEPLDDAILFCKEHDIFLDAVNENLDEIVTAFGDDCRKIFAHEYWDDRAFPMSEKDIGDFSDGFHTFNELYAQRLTLTAALFNSNANICWKAKRHHDGELCFGGGWFIVGIDTPRGQYTYHYEEKYWGMFECQELPVGKEWDGHTAKDVDRLLSLVKPERRNLSPFEQYQARRPSHACYSR